MKEFTHFDNSGAPRMVDVSEKGSTLRTATAECNVFLNSETFDMVMKGEMRKGDVLGIAQTAGIMAAKKCPDLIPLCHPITITGVEMEMTTNKEDCSVNIKATVRTKGETGAEMEALTAVSVAGLTIYDMCKAVQKDIKISDVSLLCKSGGKSDYKKNKGVE